MSHLTGEPGTKYRIRIECPEMDIETEIAEADENGVIRDGRGRSYSSGAYSIIEEIEQ